MVADLLPGFGLHVADSTHLTPGPGSRPGPPGALYPRRGDGLEYRAPDPGRYHQLRVDRGRRRRDLPELRGGTVLDSARRGPRYPSPSRWSSGAWIANVGFQGVVPYWSGPRLAPAMAGAHAAAPLQSGQSGPVLGWIYPPVSALAYLPAAFVPDPDLAVVAARCLSLFYYYAACGVAVLRRPGWPGRAQARPAPAVPHLRLASGESRPLVYSSTEVHADAPALGLAALAVLLVTRSRGRRTLGVCGPRSSWPCSRSGPSSSPSRSS